MDILLSFPIIVLALVVVAMLGQKIVLGVDVNLIVAIGIPMVPRVARVVRASALAIRELPYIDAARAAGVPLQVNACGSVLTPFFTDAPVTDYASATTANTDRYARFFRSMLARGIYIWEWRSCFLSTAHSDADVERFIDVVHRIGLDPFKESIYGKPDSKPADRSRPLATA